MTIITMRYPSNAPVVVSIVGNGANFRRLEPSPDGSVISKMTEGELLAVQGDVLVMDFVRWLRERDGNEN